MRTTWVLYKQHLARMFKRHWKVQGQFVPGDTGAESGLVAMGIPVHNMRDILQEKHKFERFEFVRQHGRSIPLDSNHPLYHEHVCHLYRSKNVLLEGLEQAKVLTKTVEIQDGFTEKIDTHLFLHNLPDQDELVQRYILSSHVFNALQAKLPHLHDPKRPAFTFPRELGITDARRSHLVCTKLLHLCGVVPGNIRRVTTVADGFVILPIIKDNDLIQFEVDVNLLLNASYALPAVADDEAVKEAEDIPLPDLTPLKHTISLEKDNFYEIKNEFPILAGTRFPYAHTAIIYYDKTEVQNLYETPVTENQILGRTLIHSFAVAAANARQRFGVNARDLPSPVTIQCIQTDGRLFHFSVFQLNTLNLDGMEGKRNLFWMLPRMALFDSCCYKQGKPTLVGYNPMVFRRFLAFCLNM